MTRSLLHRSLGVTLLAGGLAGAVTMFPLSPAGADAPGMLSVSPASGTTGSGLTLTTSGPCENPDARAIQARITGSGFPAAGQSISGVTSFDAVSTDTHGGYLLPL